MFQRDNHKMVFTGICKGDLYIVDFTKKAQPRTCLIAKSSKGCLWHRRLGHVGMRILISLLKVIMSLERKMLYLTRIDCAVHVKQENMLEEATP